ncbi:MAG: LysR substrate-binding domain-containing protein [Aestuariivita sp.]|uniref:LysR substrate-binding domain-containing protein n=1 Tax=Aestuariivita sp. TaxID=1872407 RepID=UPI003BB11E9D
MRLPPLNALRAFEAAARTGSFTAAAKEIGVSSAAISQQVRNLESYLGRKLFFRNNNQIQLTDGGRDLYQNAAAALNQIATFTSGLRDPGGPRPLVISALPSLADRWLPGLLARFEGASVRLRVEEDPVDLENEGIDMRFTYGAQTYPGLWSQPLFRDEVVPMAAPALAADWDAAVPEFRRLRLIQMDWGPSFSTMPTWSDWCRARDLAAPERIAITVPGNAAALALAEAGAGVALGQTVLAQTAMASGRLVRLSQVTIPLHQPYVVVISHARLALGRVRRMLDALEMVA